MKKGASQTLQGICRVWGCQVSVEALRLEDGKFLVVISPDATQGLVKDYALRCDTNLDAFAMQKEW